jgi:hypothetical protein
VRVYWAQVAAWLLAARAQDVLLLQQVQRTEQSPAAGHVLPDQVHMHHVTEPQAVGPQLLVATAVSAQHAAACAQAVAWQVRGPACRRR